jgi:hypothetical protein
MGEGSLHARERTSVGIILGQSGGCGRSSVKQKVARILSDASKVISPWMRCSFSDRQYSPSTGMNQSEWEIIVGVLICMGLLVKHEPVSDDD